MSRQEEKFTSLKISFQISSKFNLFILRSIEKRQLKSKASHIFKEDIPFTLISFYIL